MKDRIKIKPSHVGLFTAKASKAGMSVTEYAKHVTAPGSGASTVTKKQAQFAINASGWNKK